MKTGARQYLAFLALLLGACGDPLDDAGPDAPPPATLPGVWLGVFPCDNCPGIDTTLWLRPDERFFIEQQFPAGDEQGSAPMTTRGLGRWQWNAEERILVLDGAGPDRIFERLDVDTILMRTASPLEHRLNRNPVSPAFVATIRLRGMARLQGDVYVLKECLTGFELPLGTGGDYAQFRRQFRSVVPRGEAAPVDLEGHFTWAANGAPASFRVEHFVTVRAEGGC